MDMNCEEYRKKLEAEHKVFLTQLKSSLGVVSCPGCKEGIQKIKDCNHMTCPYGNIKNLINIFLFLTLFHSCGAEFCYICGADFEKHHAPDVPCAEGCKCYQKHPWGDPPKCPYFTEQDLL